VWNSVFITINDTVGDLYFSCHNDHNLWHNEPGALELKVALERITGVAWVATNGQTARVGFRDNRTDLRESIRRGIVRAFEVFSQSVGDEGSRVRMFTTTKEGIVAEDFFRDPIGQERT